MCYYKWSTVGKKTNFHVILACEFATFCPIGLSQCLVHTLFSFLMLPKVISGYQKGCTLDNFLPSIPMVTSTKKADEKGNFGVMVSAVDSHIGGMYNLHAIKQCFILSLYRMLHGS